MKTWNSHRRRLERGMVAGVLSAVVLTASMSIQVLAADSNTVFTSGEPQGAAIAVTANAGAAQNVSKSFLTYTDTAKQEKAEAEKQAEPAGERKIPITTIGSTIIKNRLNGLIK